MQDCFSSSLETDDKDIRREREIDCLPFPSSTFHTSHSSYLFQAGVVDAGPSLAQRLRHLGRSLLERVPERVWLAG